MKITTLNVNGIRSAYSKGFVGWAKNSNPDILCLQEVRADLSQIPEEIASLNYNSFYSVAEKKGYSGVGILSKEKPVSVTEGIGVDWIDREGRVLTAEFEHVVVCSVYAPSGTTGDLRQELKMDFLDHFFRFASGLYHQSKPVVFCGDFNICHTEIDIHNPAQNQNTSGFLPEERAWVDKMIDFGWIDVFRALYPGEKDLYSWWSFRAASRARNKGWRIDYHLCHPAIAKKATKGKIETEIPLSDHAPVSIYFED